MLEGKYDKSNIISNISYKNYAVFSLTFNNDTESLKLPQNAATYTSHEKCHMMHLSS